MKIAQFGEIINSIHQAYGSLTVPNFSLLKFDERISPLQETQAWFGNAKVTDDTDPNTDVCFSFLIQSAKGETLKNLPLNIFRRFFDIYVVTKLPAQQKQPKRQDK